MHLLVNMLTEIGEFVADEINYDLDECYNDCRWDTPVDRAIYLNQTACRTEAHYARVLHSGARVVFLDSKYIGPYCQSVKPLW